MWSSLKDNNNLLANPGGLLSNQMLKRSRGVVLVFGIMLLILSGCATFNPATGRNEMILFTTPMEVMLGQQSHAQISGSMHFSNDQAALARLNRIGQRIAQVSDRQDYQYNFYLVDKDEMNAFTTPGGNVYFYTGLYNKLKTDDEIAAVIAHEIGHCSARHVAKKFQASLGYDLLSGMILGRMQDEMMARLARMGADAIMALASSAYSRDDEYQADRLGVKYMYLARFDPEGMVTTFRILAESSKGDDNDWILLRSHPRMQDRIDSVEKEIAAVKSKY